MSFNDNRLLFSEKANTDRGHGPGLEKRGTRTRIVGTGTGTERETGNEIAIVVIAKGDRGPAIAGTETEIAMERETEIGTAIAIDVIVIATGTGEGKDPLHLSLYLGDPLMERGSVLWRKIFLNIFNSSKPSVEKNEKLAPNVGLHFCPTLGAM